jgi:hypothetical protein
MFAGKTCESTWVGQKVSENVLFVYLYLLYCLLSIQKFVARYTKCVENKDDYVAK